jgi:Flp pilus assembly protein TadB
MASLLALLLLLFFSIKFFLNRSKSEEYEEEPIDEKLLAAMSPDQRAQYQARRKSAYRAWLIAQQKEAKRQRVLRVNLPALFIVAVAFIEAVVILFATQDFSLDWVFADIYAVIFAMFLFVQLLTPLVAASIHNGRRENQLLLGWQALSAE